jgi:predicted methyltransferase/ribosomal protein S18 acetylase RimI-like enzyme
MYSKAEDSNSVLLRRIAKDTALKEGEEGIRKILREIWRNKKISTKDLAKLTLIPVPTAAAARKELEKAGLITRAEGAFLTPTGEELAAQLGLTLQQTLACPTCQGKTIRISEDFLPLLEGLRKHLATRPKPLTRLDQAHATPATALRRALYMLEQGDVEGRNILFLGDDDFTSIATGLLKAAKNILVIDVDSRLLEAIQRISREEHLGIACLRHDLRTPLPTNLHRQFDVVFTDPPYTTPGLALFLSRGLTALRSREGASVYLAYAHQPPRRLLTLQKTLNALGLAISELIPRFNLYEGAEMFANTTFLARLETTTNAKPLIVEAFTEKLYTGDITPTLRVYQCGCGKEVRVGATEAYATIEELKARGCPACGKRKGFTLMRRSKLKETLAETLTLRSYRPSDFQAVLEFEREIASASFPDAPILDATYHRRKLEKASTSPSDSLKVATLNEVVVGWLWLKTEKDRNTGERFGYVKSIAVRPDQRFQHFGRYLLEAAEQHFRGKGMRRVDLIVSAKNYAASLFFEEAGYEREHSTMRKRLNPRAEEE